MALARVGSITETSSTAQAPTIAVTVPTCDLMVLGVIGYHATANFFTASTAPTIAGASMVAGPAGANASTSYFMGAMFYKVNPTAGSQNLVISWSSAPTNGVTYAYGFYSGVDTASPVRDSDGVQTASGARTTKSLTAVSGDLIIAHAGFYAAAERTTSWTGATRITEYVTVGIADGAWAEAAPTGNQTVSYTDTQNEDGGLSAIVFKAAGGGAAVTYPQLERGIRGLERGLVTGMANH